jgi:hypothetical protein
VLDERDFVPGRLEVSIMGKGSRLRRARRMDALDLEKKFAERMTKNFQKELRNSELWDQIVAQFVEERAEEIIKECKAEVEHDI